MQLLANERVLLEDKNKTLQLTTHRVRYETRVWGSEEIISIMLDDVCSCGLVGKSWPWLLILAGLGVIAAVISQLQHSDVTGIAIVAAVVCAAFYYLTRRHVLAIASAGHKIQATTRGMSTDAVLAFIDQLEAAKAQLRMGTRISESSYASPSSAANRV